MSSSVFSYWAESFNVTVLSKDGLPMKNVNVTVIYQTNRCGAHSEVSKLTNSSGSTSFSIMNTVDESFGTCVERIYTIRADFSGYSNSTIGQVNGTNKNYVLWLPFIIHIINVRNAANVPIQNAQVTAYDVTYSTDAAGNAYVLLPVGMSSQVIVKYGEISKSVSVNPSLSSSTNVSLSIYDLKVALTDENGNYLKGQIAYKDVKKEITDSYVIFNMFSDPNPVFYVTVNGVTKQVKTSVSSDNIVLRFDLTPPIISDIQTRVSDNRLYISASIVDPGRYASGIISNPLLSYETNSSSQAGLKMYFVGNNRYETSIPLGSEEIKYTITATDAQGNKDSYSDTYSPSFKPEKEIEKVTKGQFSWITVIGIFIFAIVIYFIYQKIKEQTQ
jgi:hypothetical protein